MSRDYQTALFEQNVTKARLAMMRAAGDNEARVLYANALNRLLFYKHVCGDQKLKDMFEGRTT